MLSERIKIDERIETLFVVEQSTKFTPEVCASENALHTIIHSRCTRDIQRLIQIESMKMQLRKFGSYRVSRGSQYFAVFAIPVTVEVSKPEVKSMSKKASARKKPGEK